MKKTTLALCFCVLYVSLSGAQFSVAGDSVYTTPARPTIHDSITYNFFDSNACCCAEFVNPAVRIQDTMVFLSFSVNTTPCQVCKCAGTGLWNKFKGAPLKAGRYGIYRQQAFYCPTGFACPAIVLLPVRIGEVVVSNTALRVDPRTPDLAPISRLALTRDKNTVTMAFSLNLPGLFRVDLFDARGVLKAKIYNGQTGLGPHLFSWTAPAQGIYFMSATLNNLTVAERKIVVSR
jgi:hypothetical protein